MVEFGAVRLFIDGNDNGSKPYKEAKWFAEWQSSLYTDIKRLLDPKIVLDIGANYGLTVLLEYQNFPDAKIIAAEPNASLWPYLERNAKENGLTQFKLFKGLVGDSLEQRSFGVLHQNSQDSRVVGPDERWTAVETQQATLDSLAGEIGADVPVYIKVDTQGYEARVFRGGEGFLSRNKRWLLKTEFAPNWLRSQGTDPAELLNYLVDRYAVAEAPSLVRFKERLEDTLAPGSQLQKGEISSFLDHVENLNRKRMGWVDLFVFPRALNDVLLTAPKGGRLARAMRTLTGG